MKFSQKHLLFWPLLVSRFAIGGLWMVVRSLRHAASHPSVGVYLSVAFIALIFAGGVFIILMLARDMSYRSLTVDLERRTFRYERAWPFRCDSGPLDEITGICNRGGFLSLVFKDRIRFGRSFGSRGITLGIFGAGAKAAAAPATSLAHAMGLDVVEPPVKQVSVTRKRTRGKIR